MYSLSQIEQWIKVGVPVIISIAYQPGELVNAPIPSSSGHIIVVRGFTSQGDVITNDPAVSTNAEHVETLHYCRHSGIEIDILPCV